MTEDPHTNAGGPTGPARKKRSPLKIILISIASLAGAAILAIVILGGALLGRISAPGTHTFSEEDAPAISTALPSSTATPAQSADSAAATPLPTPTPVEDPWALDAEGEEPDDPNLEEFQELPLVDLYPQTELTSAQQAAMKAQNANKSEYVNILLVGVDRRGTRGDSNADTIMIATLDKRNGRLKLTSILRDCYVPIPGGKDGRINSAAAQGGIPLLMKTINEMLHMEIENYVLVDFAMFEKIINKLGGIAVYMSAKEISAANDNIAGLNKQRGVDYLWDGFIFANAGNVRLNGKQALAYARIRKIDSDFVRTNRQFKVLSAIFAKFRSQDAAKQYELLYDLLPLVETDLNALQIADIGLAALSMDTAGILHQTIPYDGYYKSGSVKGKSAIALDMPASAWKLHRFIYTFIGEPEEAKLLSGGPSLPPRTPSPTLDPSLWPQDPWGSPLPTDDAQEGDAVLPEIPDVVIPDVPIG